jgi:hypothetical protein
MEFLIATWWIWLIVAAVMNLATILCWGAGFLYKPILFIVAMFFALLSGVPWILFIIGIIGVIVRFAMAQ